MREYFHYYCTLGCSWLPLVSFLKAGVHRPVVPLGSDVPGEGHPCVPEGPQYNPKAIPLFSWFLMFLSKHIKVWGEVFLKCHLWPYQVQPRQSNSVPKKTKFCSVHFHCRKAKHPVWVSCVVLSAGRNKHWLMTIHPVFLKENQNVTKKLSSRCTVIQKLLQILL